MMRRWFPAVGGGALALVLLSAGTSSAQFLFGLGGLGMMGRYNPRTWYPPSVGYTYYRPGNFSSVTYANTPLYYGLSYGGGGMGSPVASGTLGASYAVYGAGYGGGYGGGSYAAYGLRSGGFSSMGAPAGGFSINYAPSPPLAYTGGMPAIAPVAYSRPVVDDRTAVIAVRLPGTAKLFFDGARTRQTGRERTFTTPALDRGKTFHYTVEATWMKEGKPVTQKQTVEVRAGGRATVVFPKPKS